MDIGLNINIIQWNIQGFINHKYALELLIAKHSPNIVALQETHINRNNLHLLHLPGFKAYHHNKDYSYAKAGIAIFVRNNLNVSQQQCSRGDLLFLSIISNCGRELQITNIYSVSFFFSSSQNITEDPQHKTRKYSSSIMYKNIHRHVSHRRFTFSPFLYLF